MSFSLDQGGEEQVMMQMGEILGMVWPMFDAANIENVWMRTNVFTVQEVYLIGFNYIFIRMKYF